MPTSIPPFLIFFAGALLVPFLRDFPRLRAAWLVLIPIVGALNVWGIQEGFELQYRLLGYTLTPVRADRLSLLFGYLFHLGAFIAIIYSLHLKKGDSPTVQHTSAVVYAGSALGAVFAGDFITLFVFWELLAISSVFLIWTRRTPEAISAGCDICSCTSCRASRCSPAPWCTRTGPEASTSARWDWRDWPRGSSSSR